MDVFEGKIYVTKSGERIGPVIWDDVVGVWRRSADFVRNTGDYWHKDGTRYGHCEDELDFQKEDEE